MSLVVVLAFIAQAQVEQVQVEHRYDRFRDYSITQLIVGQIGKTTDDVTLALFYFAQGEKVQPISETGRVDLVFLSRSEHWKFLKSNDMHILTSNGRYSAKRANHDGDVNFGAGVSEMVSASIAFAEFEKVASSEKVEIAVGTAEFTLAPNQIEAFRLFAAELKMDAAALEVMAKERKRLAKLRAEEDRRQANLRAEEDRRQANLRAEEDRRRANLQAEEDRRRAEEDRKARAIWDSKVVEVYTVARKALIEAKNRGSFADPSIRKYRIKKEIEKVAAELCRKYEITREQLDRIMIEGAKK